MPTYLAVEMWSQAVGGAMVSTDVVPGAPGDTFFTVSDDVGGVVVFPSIVLTYENIPKNWLLPIPTLRFITLTGGGPIISTVDIGTYVFRDEDPVRFSLTNTLDNYPRTAWLHTSTFQKVNWNQAETVDITMDHGAILSLMKRNDFNGRLHFGLHCFGFQQITFRTPNNPAVPGPQGILHYVTNELVNVYANYETGMEGPVLAQSRVDRCPKCGRMSLRENWVMDGWSKRLVGPECYDPRDPLEERRFPRLGPEDRGGINNSG